MGYCLTDGSLGEVEPCPDWVADPACFTFKVGKLLHFVKKVPIAISFSTFLTNSDLRLTKPII